MVHIRRLVMVNCVAAAAWGWVAAPAAAALRIDPVIHIAGPGPAERVAVGVDADGDAGPGHFSFFIATDDDGDGAIALPALAEGARLAVGVNDQEPAGEIMECLIFDLAGSGVSQGQRVETPMFLTAALVEGFQLGIDYGALAQPPAPIMPGAVFDVIDGRLEAWPGIRVVSHPESETLEDFARGVDSYPGYTGQVTVSESLVRFDVVPEPGSLLLGLLGVALLCDPRLSRRCRWFRG